MSRKLPGWLLAGTFLLVSMPALAQDSGTAEEARAMLERAAEALQEDEQAALTTFTEGEGEFKDRDLYVFCGGPDGDFTAHGANADLVGQSLRDLKDKTGTPLGEEIYDTATEGEIQEVAYMWPRPGETEPVPKSTYVTKVGDQHCGVGYYPQ